jgi:pimeloyl-ACP methyl ester carboxylesterase
MEVRMLKKQVSNQTVYYHDSQNDKQALVLLHGWGQSGELMMPIYDYFKDQYRVINVDFPGFGHSEALKQTWGVYDYAAWLHAFLSALNIENPIIVAHSFGARIAIVYSNQHAVQQLVLTGAAGIKDKQSLLVKGKIATYKVLKQLVKLPGLNRYEDQLKKHFGSSDYKETTGFKRSSFVKIVNEDLSGLLKNIKASTLLVWGEHDQATPLWMAKHMEKTIPDAGLVVFEGDDHYAYFHQSQRFNLIIEVFFNALKENN